MDMTTNLDDRISKAMELARNEDAAAMPMANELVEQYPKETKVWAFRGYLYARNRNHAEAVADLTRAIEIDPMNPFYFFSRGRYQFALGDDRSAIDDFAAGLALCDQYNIDDYREELHFWRAEALLRLGKKREALSDLDHVHEDTFRSWTYKLRTKADLLADCNRLPSE
jgi:tetratricopeptide (TPR) repeat protein